MTTNRQHRAVGFVVGLLTAGIVTVVGLSGPVDASTPPIAATASPAPTAAAAAALTQAETRGSPSDHGQGAAPTTVLLPVSPLPLGRAHPSDAGLVAIVIVIGVLLATGVIAGLRLMMRPSARP